MDCCKPPGSATLARESQSFKQVGIENGVQFRGSVTLLITRANGEAFEVPLIVRIDTPVEVGYFTHGGILPFVLTNLMAENDT